MLTSDPVTLSAVLGLAASAGIVHTLAGPDHYLPLVAVARARRWSLQRASMVTLGFGLLHCLASVALVFGLVASVGATAWLSTTAAWLMVGVGLGLILLALRRGRGPATVAGGRLLPVLLGLAFALGPCEWLIPVATTTVGAMGTAAGLLVCAVYTLATVGTMWAAMALGAFGVERCLPGWLRGRRSVGVLGGVLCAACGLLMLVGF